MLKSWLVVLSIAKLRFLFLAVLILWAILGFCCHSSQHAYFTSNSYVQNSKFTKTESISLKTAVIRAEPPIILEPVHCNSSSCNLKPPYTEWIRSYEGAAYKQSNNIENKIHCKIKPVNSSLFEMRQFESLPKNFLDYLRLPIPQAVCGRNGLLTPWRLSENVKDVWMLFIVKSAIHHLQARGIIRETWASIESLRGMRFGTLFLLGKPQNNEEQKLLEKENKLFGDILQCDVFDEYKALPLKVLSSFRWMLEGHVTATYYTVTDDDCVMNLMNINTFFQVEREDDVMYCGFMFDQDARVNRDHKSKWYIRRQVYPGAFYPTFCHGGMWSVQKSLMRDIYCVSEVTDRQQFYLEDVYITGILREKLGRLDANILPSTTNNGRKFVLMYYPWDETKRAYAKMTSKWRRLNRTLPWGLESSSGDQLVQAYSTNFNSVSPEVKALLLQWGHLKDVETQTTIFDRPVMSIDKRVGGMQAT